MLHTSSALDRTKDNNACKYVHFEIPLTVYIELYYETQYCCGFCKLE